VIRVFRGYLFGPRACEGQRQITFAAAAQKRTDTDFPLGRANQLHRIVLNFTIGGSPSDYVGLSRFHCGIVLPTHAWEFGELAAGSRPIVFRSLPATDKSTSSVLFLAPSVPDPFVLIPLF
jgi:hypothetical protein